MKTKGTHFWLLLLALVAAGALVNFYEVAGEARVARQHLAEFPRELGAWRQRGPDARFDAATEAILRADDYVTRDYAGADGRTASLYIGYYRTQRTGATYHSPLNCLPGSGWQLGEAQTVEIKPADGAAPFAANLYTMSHGSDRFLMVYWYQGRGRAVASEYWDKVYTVVDSVRLRRSDGAMVRVLVPVVGQADDDALKTAVEFAAHSVPHLSAFVPD